MIDGIKRYNEGKFDRKAFTARIKALPKEYQKAYADVQSHMWSFGGQKNINGTDIMNVLIDVLQLFEDGAAKNRDVLNVMGINAGTFAENLLREIEE
jgi:DNA-binding ferritin-like protein (Dps family)